MTTKWNLDYSSKFVKYTTIINIVLLVKNQLILIILFLLKNIETNPKTPKFKVCDRAIITKDKNALSKG